MGYQISHRVDDPAPFGRQGHSEMIGGQLCGQSTVAGALLPPPLPPQPLYFFHPKIIEVGKVNYNFEQYQARIWPRGTYDNTHYP